MFHPMALTVVIALLGAMILSITFIPAAVALFIGKKVSEKENKLMVWAKQAYEPLLERALEARAVVVTIAGIAVPMTRSTTFLASYIHKNDRDLANRDANQFALGASYVVSRKTDFYAALSHTVNTNSTGILIGGAARPSGSSAVNVGMRHAF